MYSGQAVRRLLGVELWKLQGGSEKMWALLAGDKLHEQNVRPTGQVKEAILRGVPVQQAMVMVERWDALEMRGSHSPEEKQLEAEEELKGSEDFTRVLVAGVHLWRGAAVIGKSDVKNALQEYYESRSTLNSEQFGPFSFAAPKEQPSN